jgi:hypothetical protein
MFGVLDSSVNLVSCILYSSLIDERKIECLGLDHLEHFHIYSFGAIGFRVDLWTRFPGQALLE